MTSSWLTSRMRGSARWHEKLTPQDWLVEAQDRSAVLPAARMEPIWDSWLR